MSQVVSVAFNTGKYVFLNKEGRQIDPDVDSTIISSEDADVLMERIRQGYQYICPGHYVMRLEMTGPTYDQSYFEFTELVTFDMDDDGYPIPRHATLIAQETYDLPTTDQGRINTKVVFIDYEAQVLRWLCNPLAEQPFVSDVKDAAVCCEADDEIGMILTIGTRYLMRGQPVHVSAINVREYM